MTRNLGQCSLRRKKRSGDPMSAYDGLPPLLRKWLSQAALPWSPESVRRIWLKALANGLTPEEALGRLSRAEVKTLSRDRRSTLSLSTSGI